MTPTSFPSSNIKTFFATANYKLEKISLWFIANRLSLNVRKTKYTLFYKKSVRDNIPLKLPDLKWLTTLLKEQPQ